MINVFLLLLVSGIIVAFSVQNDVPVTIEFLIWEFEISFAWAAIVAVLAGVVITQLLDRLRAKRQGSARRNIEFLSRRSRW